MRRVVNLLNTIAGVKGPATADRTSGNVVEHSRADRFVDVGSVFLISIAAVLTALCGYQSGRWGGQQMRLYNVANTDRIASAEAAGRGNALSLVDVITFLNYLNAVDAGDMRKADFLYARFRPEMRPALKAWIASKPFKNEDAPSSPFVMRQYSLQTTVEAKADAEAADVNFRAAQEANRHSDDFLLITVVFSGSSFMAGISTKMSYPRHAIVIAVAMVGLIYGLIRLIGLPFL